MPFLTQGALSVACAAGHSRARLHGGPGVLFSEHIHVSKSASRAMRASLPTVGTTSVQPNPPGGQGASRLLLMVISVWLESLVSESWLLVEYPKLCAQYNLKAVKLQTKFNLCR